MNPNNPKTLREEICELAAIWEQAAIRYKESADRRLAGTSDERILIYKQKAHEKAAHELRAILDRTGG